MEILGLPREFVQPKGSLLLFAKLHPTVRARVSCENQVKITSKSQFGTDYFLLFAHLPTSNVTKE